ncbi:LRR domain containing protein [Trema orientale]|uniref:LRR domain containing protein n=1 Tax=Trema orientale TaxID=63057 RepID=A0A2P5FT55_TREOI|nr:LRR domain containing protein [Trema orientale]
MVLIFSPVSKMPDNETAPNGSGFNAPTNPRSCHHDFIGEVTKLRHLDLSSTGLRGEIPLQLGNLSSLQFLVLCKSDLSAKNLDWLSHLCSLTMGSLPNLTLFSSLRELRLGTINLNGTISESIGQLARLEVFDVLRNYLRGVISEAHFLLSKLTHLGLSFNWLSLNISSDWSPPFQLNFVLLWSCKLGPQVPTMA